VFCTSNNGKDFCEELKVNFVNYTDDTETQINTLKENLKHSDILIAAARRLNQKAPRIVTREVLKIMKSNSVVCDLAKADGGNVEGSKTDSTLRIEGCVVTSSKS